MKLVYISVILPVKLDWTPCYAVHLPESEDCGETLSVGTRVRVLFGSKVHIGVISETGVKPSVDESKVKPVMSVESSLPKVSEHELELWKFVADYYLCSVGEVYKAAYPSGKVEGEVSRMLSSRKAEERRLEIAEKKISAAEARRENLVCRAERKRKQMEKARSEKTLSGYRDELELLEQSLHDVEKKISCLKASLSAAPESSGADAASGQAPRLDFALSASQKIAEERIRKAFSEHKPVLLQGVTGSGKTELHIALAAETLARGKNVLYLIPEIAVSRQMEERLRRIFGDMLLVFHSKETSARRLETASAVRAGRYVVLGTRSALFLPHHELGLVIVDEEHDTSYKQDSPAPRYNGRDTALMLARIHGADAVMSTATPSLESLYNCRTGRAVKVELSEKYYGAEDSDVEIIDTLAERRKNGMSGDFSYKLINHIREALAGGGQVLLLRGRRSYAPSVQCSSCGNIPKCRHCNVPLSWHKAENVLMCHYCGWRTDYTGICTECGGRLIPLGAGTQKIEEEVAALFPDARVARLDSDVAASSGKEISIIRDFARQKIDILVGTQIISKGFDFDNIALVAVLQADSLLARQDFRADERAFQLLEQFRGRSGRRGRKGLFVIQTSQPSHPVYSLLARSGGQPSVNAEKTLADSLMGERFEFGYPPFSRVVRVILKDRSEERADRMAGILASDIRAAFGVMSARFVQDASSPVSVVGPYTPAVDRMNDFNVRHIRVNFRKDSSLAERKFLLASSVAKFERGHSYAGHVALDVDPI